MSADLHIHVLDKGVTENDVRAFQSNVIGSKHFRGVWPAPDYDKLFEKISETSNVWIGEVSWLKAGVTDDPGTFIPPTVMQIHEVMDGEFPVVDDTFIEKICATFQAENPTSYSLNTVDKVRAFLTQHKGKQAFSISW